MLFRDRSKNDQLKVLKVMILGEEIKQETETAIFIKVPIEPLDSLHRVHYSPW